MDLFDLRQCSSGRRGAFWHQTRHRLAIVIFAAYRIGSRTLNTPLLCLIASLAFIALIIFKLPFPFIILTAGLIGYYAGRVMPQRFEPGKAHGAAGGNVPRRVH